MLSDVSLTYPEVGATSGELPDGYGHLRRTTTLPGTDLDRAGDLLLGWEMHRRAGLRVPPTPPAAPGLDVRMRLGVGPLGVGVPCRVVYVVDEPDRRGFAYGTLSGHPETGEELFAVTLTGEVLTFSVVAFSRPASRLARLSGPLGSRMQSVMTDRYLRAMRDLVAGR